MASPDRAYRGVCLTPIRRDRRGRSSGRGGLVGDEDRFEAGASRGVADIGQLVASRDERIPDRCTWRVAPDGIRGQRCPVSRENVRPPGAHQIGVYPGNVEPALEYARFRRFVPDIGSLAVPAKPRLADRPGQ